MTINVGTVDRVVRLVVGVALIAAALFSSMTIFDAVAVKYGAIALGLVLTATGLMRTCPMYSILGIQTCKV
ncbi:DUF2892 domain-containing protein [Ensifer sp. HO-A22]|uniref:DUF2892 domain-containing protein n=1 Tax=Ensifer oleiphilus TaxID=2742698 RepID=A0A7Y6UR08_9HYPH|nr:DUF2892 domain-containing protein [Ensifer oleiphilus]NVD42842.1 DUF2892 domain-containing protein [Ensifer oleiphilus]